VTEAIPLNEAKTRLSELVRRVEAGEEIVIRRGQVPVVRLVAERSSTVADPGALRGRISIAEDFDAPMPEFEAYLADDT
jgi:prevent-host-death family protein